MERDLIRRRDGDADDIKQNTSTMQIRITNDRISPAPSSKLDDTKLMSAEIRTVTRKISAIHLKSGRADLPVFFFFAAAKAASKIMLTI